MLKKDYQENIFVVQCNDCEKFERLNYSVLDNKSATKQLESKGWYITKFGDNFEHYCPDCVEKKSKKVKERKKNAKENVMLGVAPKIIYGACTLCNGDLVLRESRFGKFYGCQRYPKCYKTVKVEFAVKYLIKK